MVIVSFFASFKQIWITKYTDFVEASITESNRVGGGGISPVEANYSSGTEGG